MLTRGRGDDERAEVAWEWDDPDTAACDQDMATQNTSDECMAVRRHMRTPIDRMDRVLFELVDPS